MTLIIILLQQFFYKKIEKIIPYLFLNNSDMDSLIGLPHNLYYLPSEIIIDMLTYLTPYELYKVMISCKKNYLFVAKYSNVFARNFLRTLSHEQGFHAWDLFHKTAFTNEIKPSNKAKRDCLLNYWSFIIMHQKNILMKNMIL